MLRSTLPAALAGAVSAIACAVVVAQGATPIDRSLPWIAIIVALVAASAKEMNVFFAVPMLVAAEVAIADDRVRLLAYGVIVTAAFVAAAVPEINLPLVAAGVLLLRWIPLRLTFSWREVVVLAGVLALFAAMRSRTPLALTIALAVALVTPVTPTRMIVYPWIVAALVLLPRPATSDPRSLVVIALFVIGAFARYSTAPLWFLAAAAMLVPLAARTRVALPVVVIGIVMLILFPWSGIVAHVFPLPISLVALVGVLAVALVGETASLVAGVLAAGALLFVIPPLQPRTAAPIGIALAANQSYAIDIPPNAKSAVVAISGANVASLKPGTVVGRVDDRDLRIGDIADFGFMRREHFHASRNTLPRDPVWDVRGYGQMAWLYGAGRITIDHPASPLLVTAAPSLPDAARLEIESVETR